MIDPVVGNLELARAAEHIEVRGRAIPARRGYILRHHGESVLQSFLESLEPELRELLESPPLAFSWVNLSKLVALDCQLVDFVWGGRVSPMRQLHAEMAENDMTMAYKVLFKFGTPSFILSRIDLAYRHYFRPGGIDIVELTDSHAIGKLRGEALPMYMCTEALPGWTRAGVELSGGRNVAVLHTSCRHRGDTDCTWELSWK